MGWRLYRTADAQPLGNIGVVELLAVLAPPEQQLAAVHPDVMALGG